MSSDWLNPDNEKIASAQRAAALEIASRYLVFQTNQQARELLAMWDQQIRRKRTPLNASIQEYAANEAMRAFIEGIHDQINIALTMKGNAT